MIFKSYKAKGEYGRLYVYSHQIALTHPWLLMEIEANEIMLSNEDVFMIKQICKH